MSDIFGGFGGGGKDLNFQAAKGMRIFYDKNMRPDQFVPGPFAPANEYTKVLMAAGPKLRLSSGWYEVAVIHGKKALEHYGPNMEKAILFTNVKDPGKFHTVVKDDQGWRIHDALSKEVAVRDSRAREERSYATKALEAAQRSMKGIERANSEAFEKVYIKRVSNSLDGASYALKKAVTAEDWLTVKDAINQAKESAAIIKKTMAETKIKDVPKKEDGKVKRTYSAKAEKKEVIDAPKALLVMEKKLEAFENVFKANLKSRGGIPELAVNARDGVKTISVAQGISQDRARAEATKSKKVWLKDMADLERDAGRDWGQDPSFRDEYKKTLFAETTQQRKMGAFMKDNPKEEDFSYAVARNTILASKDINSLAVNTSEVRKPEYMEHRVELEELSKNMLEHLKASAEMAQGKSKEKAKDELEMDIGIF